jgi:hypothetical protein
VINAPNIQRVWFLDEAADQPDEDWVYIEDHHPLEFYHALDASWEAGEEAYEASEELSASVKQFIEKFEGDIGSFLHTTRLYFVEGRKIEFWGEAKQLSQVVFDAYR